MTRPPAPRYPARVRVKRALLRALKLLALVACAGGGVFLIYWGAVQTAKVRQLERVPHVDNAAVIGGEVKITGRATPTEAGAGRAPDSRSATLVYEYERERRRRDADGDYVWRTEAHDLGAVDFLVRDDTGDVYVAAAAAVSDLSFTGESKHRRRQGNTRVRESRLDPGDSVLVFGHAVPSDEGIRIDFQRDGNYYPLITTRGESGERRLRAILTALLLTAGSAALLTAVFLFSRRVVKARTRWAAAAAIAAVLVALAVQWTSMMIDDLRAADERLDRVLGHGSAVIDDLVSPHGLAWDGDLGALESVAAELEALPDDARERLEQTQKSLAMSIELTNARLSRFPERLLAPLLGIRPRAYLDAP